MKRSHIFGVLFMTFVVCSSHAFAQGTLLVWWKLDESSGTTTNDSANSNNGLISGNPVWQSSGGYIDGALEFDGSGDKIEDSDAENFLNGLTAITVSLWIESDFTNVDKGIFVTQDPSGTDSFLSMRYDKVGANGGQNEVIKFALRTSSGGANYESSALVQTTSWQHLAMTWSSGETPKLFINGTLDTFSFSSGSLGGSLSDVTKLIVGIGIKSNYWDGRIDDFRIYDGALTASEVNDLYNQISPVSHHWKFNETTGTTAADSILTSNGTLTNFPVDDSQWNCLDGGSLTFDGSDDYVSLPVEADYDFTEFVSIAAWIKVTSFGVAEQAIFTKGDTAYRLERNGSTDMLKFTVDGLTTNTVVQGSVSVNDGLWHHVAGVYDGSELLLYIDGVEDNAVVATGTMDTNNSAVYIGANAAVGGRYFNGSMNDVYIYDSALTPAAISTLAQASESQLGWWKLDESSGTTASDSGPNANNGTLQSMDGTEWTTARIDGGLDFSGSSDYINTNVASSVADSITMMGWFMSDDAGSIGNSFVTQRFMTQRDASSSSRFGLGINNNHVAVYWDDGGHNIQEAINITLVAGQWYHAAVTYDETTIRLYVNGVEEGNWPESNLSTPSSDTFEIGRGGGTRYFDGVLDDMLLYDRALCSSEIYAVYDSFVYFTDVSGSVGFDVQSSDAVTSGAGLHWADYDNDGDLDAIVTGNNYARLYLSTNEGDSFFVTNFGGGNYPRQGAMLDIDNDGDIDFWHSSESFHENNGSGSFSVIGDLGFSEPVATESTAAADVNNDGFCDVIMFSSNGNWFGTHQGGQVETLVGTNDASDGLNDAGDYGSGGYCSSGDVNNDGFLDFFYHYGTGKLFLSDGDGTYTENASGISVSTSGTQEVGSAWGDYDNDGDLDLFVPRFASGSTGYLWRNDSGTFVDVTVAAGISDTSGHRGCCWGDFDNDGYLDLYVCVSSGANVLYRNQGDGTFLSVMEGAELSGTSQDAVFVDYDNDGDLDLAITQESGTNVLLRNGNNDKSYLKVRLIGHGPALTNKGAIGVRVDLYQSNGTTFIARREIAVARGLGGTEPIWVHFGGVVKSTTYVVKAHFVSGVVDVSVVPQNVSTTIGTVTINQMLTIKERLPRIVSWKEVDPNQ